MLIRLRRTICALRAEKRHFYVKTGSADCQRVTATPLQKSHVKKAERAVWPCNGAVIALRRRHRKKNPAMKLTQRGRLGLARGRFLLAHGGPVARPNGRYGNAGRPLRQVFHPENGCKESRETLIGFLFREKQNAFFSE